ncbi:MAG: fimbrial protein [Rhizobiaceae bacterium]|nr:fimbrial protein [Rhizobiaceae bacterium]
MSHAQDEKEEPLDPAIEHIRRRMIRLLVISIGIMMVGLMAVLFAIVYKINAGSDANDAGEQSVIPGEEQSDGKAGLAENIAIDLPERSEIVSSRLYDDRLVLELAITNGEMQIWIVDLKTGQVESRISLK